MVWDKTFQEWAGRELLWLPERGMGYYPVEESPYDEGYFDKYRGYAQTERGEQITAERVCLVNRYTLSEVVDIGIGCGQFVEARGNTRGYDVNPYAVKWLIDRGLWCDIQSPIRSATFWDSLEHIHNPDQVLAKVERFAFVSLPIFRSANHILKSKHFRKDEHVWYWTHEGFIGWMREKGFKHLETLDFETRLGREGIGTYVFERCGSSS